MVRPSSPPRDISMEEIERFLFPLPKDDLSEDQRAKLMGEINIGQPMRHLALLNAFHDASNMAQRTGFKDGGRKATIYALICIFLYFRDTTGYTGHLSLLTNLINALSDLGRGRSVHPMFKAAGSATLTQDRAEAHGAIAAWAHLLGTAGVKQGEADEHVAKAIGAMGYRKRGVRQEVATARTVAEWRGEATQPDARGVDAGSFGRIIRAYREGAPESGTAQRLNDDFPRFLLSMWPHLFRLPTKPPSFSGE